MRSQVWAGRQDCILGFFGIYAKEENFLGGMSNTCSVVFKTKACSRACRLSASFHLPMFSLQKECKFPLGVWLPSYTPFPNLPCS